MTEQLYSEIKGTYTFAKAKDYLGDWHYLSADSEEAIEKYCEDYSPRGIYPHESNKLAIDQWINYVDPIMVSFHFKWVGERHNPFVISKMKHSDYAGVSGKTDGYKTAIKRDLDKW